MLDIIVLSYFSLYVYWVFGVPDMDAHSLTQLFVAINPMTAGAYCIGAAMLIHLAAYKNIIGRCVICLPYVLSTIASAVSLMGMTGWKDLDDVHTAYFYHRSCSNYNSKAAEIH